MEKIKCAVKLEGYEELVMEFLTMPNKGETISYNDELFEIRVINHIISNTPSDNSTGVLGLQIIEKTEEKKILIHASRTKRL
jgi:hypothetical protein